MIPLRLDDVGASSKYYERHRGKWFAYDEMTPAEIADVVRWLIRREQSMTVAITACWVDANGSLTPYPEQWPDQASTWKIGVDEGVVEIACHGLTHCLPGRHAGVWLPWPGNRRYHREFIADIPLEVQRGHLSAAKRILEGYFGQPVSTLVPPGNAISHLAALAARDMGYDVITCRLPPDLSTMERGRLMAGWRPLYIDDADHTVLHDRDLVGQDVGRWLEQRLHMRYSSVRAWLAKGGAAQEEADHGR